MADSYLKGDPPFRHDTMKHRMIAWISMHLFDDVTYTVRQGLLKGMKRKGRLGWVPKLLAPRTMTAEQQFWCGLDLRGKTVYGIGAFHGLRASTERRWRSCSASGGCQWPRRSPLSHLTMGFLRPVRPRPILSRSTSRDGKSKRYGARKTLVSYQPDLSLEMHGGTIRVKRRKVAEIVDFLWEIDYRRIPDIETGVMITPENTSVAMEGHLNCQRT
jgi:hypothetical protein